MGFACFPFYESTSHASFWFLIVIPSQVFPSAIVRHSTINKDSKSSVISLQDVFISCSHLVDFRPCYFTTFVLTWLLSLSLSRRGIIWRSCVHGTGFCDCGGVGVSGPGVDGV